MTINIEASKRVFVAWFIYLFLNCHLFAFYNEIIICLLIIETPSNEGTLERHDLADW